MKTTAFKTALVWSVLFLLIAGSSASMTIDVDKKGIITGRISDFTTNGPIEFVMVDLFTVKDSILVVGTLTDIEGNFSISMLDSGNYYVEINDRDFGKKIIHLVIINENVSKVNLGEILLFRMPHKSAKLFSRLAKAENSGNPQVILANDK